MTPKEKARELVDKFDKVVNAYTNETLKQSALIVVDEILSFVEDDREVFNWKEYYKEVKKQIEIL